MPRKCSDIPDTEFLAAVDKTIAVRSEIEGFQWHSATRWDVAAVLAGHPEDVGSAPVEYPEWPENLVRAKARKLIMRKLLDGCPCGCRGGFSVTMRGRSLMAEAVTPSALS